MDAKPNWGRAEDRRAYTVEEVAKKLRTTRNSVFIAVRLGKLSSFKIGKRRLFKASEIDKLIGA